MTTTYQPYLQFEHRQNKKAKIQEFFESRMGQKISSQILHEKFGSSVRTRISELNREASCPIRIVNEYVYDDFLKAEISNYRAELK